MNSSLLEDRRFWLGGGALLAVLLVAVSWLLLIGPKLGSASSYDSQNADAQTANTLIGVKNAKLAKQAAQIGDLRTRLDDAIAGLPPDSGLADFTREVVAAAKTNHVDLTTIAIGDPTPLAAAAAPAATDDTSSDSAASTPTTSTSTAAAAPGTLSIAVTLTSGGRGSDQLAFLHAVQYGDRHLLVSSSQLSLANKSRVDSVSSSTTMTTQFTVFVAPIAAAQLKQIIADLTGN